MSKSSFFELETDAQYFEKIKKIIAKNNNPKFAFFRYYKDKNMMYAKPFLFVPDSKIAHFTKDYVPISLSALEVPSRFDFRYSKPEDFSFYRYVEQQKQNKSYVSIENSTKSYIKTYKIDYIIIEKNAKYPASILKNAKKIIKNKVNGNLFLRM